MKIDDSLSTIGIPYSRVSPVKQQDDQPFAQLLEAAKEGAGDKELKEAAQQMEAMFLFQLFSQMRKTVPESGFMDGQKLAGNIFQNMFDQEVSLQAALGGGAGLADVIYQQLKDTDNTGDKDSSK